MLIVKQDSVIACESLDTCNNAIGSPWNTLKRIMTLYINSDDDFMPPRMLIKIHSHAETNGSTSEDD